ncbi:hypothetical protein BHE90_012479 [Fusarium euwallaceae]|uniref:AAA+ ATPase domain-containing protein n=1 Tax=Fusarium euwallaceae TaxID=1147111 RepID=A0A430LBH3_9HYPO|nr:hypothetical protein BHE90_012479 [Fusarium euwallaceae]
MGTLSTGREDGSFDIRYGRVKGAFRLCEPDGNAYIGKLYGFPNHQTIQPRFQGVSKNDFLAIAKGFPPFYRESFRAHSNVDVDHPVRDLRDASRAGWVVAIGFTSHSPTRMYNTRFSAEYENACSRVLDVLQTILSAEFAYHRVFGPILSAAVEGIAAMNMYKTGSVLKKGISQTVFNGTDNDKIGMHLNVGQIRLILNIFNDYSKDQLSDDEFNELQVSLPEALKAAVNGVYSWFSHDSTITHSPRSSFETGDTFAGTLVQQQYFAWKSLLRRCGRDGTMLGQELQFWEGALAILNGDDQECHQLLAKDLVDEDLRGRELVISTMSTVIFDVLAHLRIAETFLKAITHPSLLGCLSIDLYVEVLYEYFGGDHGDRAIAFLSRICREVAEDCRRRGKVHLSIIPGLTSLLVKALQELLNRDRWIRLRDDLLALTNLFDEILLRTVGGWLKPDAETLKVKIDLMRRQVRAAKDHLFVSGGHSEKHGYFGVHNSYSIRPQMPGGRHGNDLADITQVNILPTLGEILDDSTEYLPSTNLPQPHVLKNPVERYLDTYFRLLRYDVIKVAEDVLRHLLEQDNPSLNPCLPSDTKAHLYLRSSVQRIFINQSKGLEISVSFLVPPQLRDRPPSEQRRWWEESSQLEEGSLICFLSSKNGEKRLLFLEVTAKNTGSGKQGENVSSLVSQDSPPTITAKLATWMQRDFALLVRLYREMTKGVLVGFHDLIPATFVPVLKNLQQMQRTGEMAFQQWILPSHDTTNPQRGVQIPPPAYARKLDFTFPLGAISKGGDRLLSLNPLAANNTADTSTLQTLTGLDVGQCRGLVAALTREYTLIQGPPGTGKSYLGVQLVQTMLAVKSQAGLGPILVICYTNHALDQFLKHLLDVGIETIIRMGSGSQAPELAGKNLRVLDPQDPSKFTVIGPDPLRSWLGRRPSGLYEYGSDALADAEDTEDLERRAEWGIWSLASEERWTLADEWFDQSCDQQAELLFESIDQVEHLRRRKDNIHDEINRRCLLQADVVGMTTTSLARNYELLRRVSPKVIICEEAAEVMEAHVISALMPSVEHLIQIGDHKQLRPQISSHSLSLETRSGLAWQLDRSQFERRAVGEPGLPPAPVAQLNVQRRMRPEISQLLRRVYPSLRDHESVFNLPDVIGMRHNLFWLGHPYAEVTRPSGTRMTSHSNQWEVEMATALVRHLARQGQYKSSDIALLTPYTGQLRMLRAALAKDFEVFLNERDSAALASEDIDDGLGHTRAETQIQTEQKQLPQTLRLATVDNFQGEEAKVVVVSLVRSNTDHSVGFLRTENRINVLLSRAQHGMYLIGNAETYLNVPMWADVHSRLARMGGVGTALTLCCPRHPHMPIYCSEPADFEHKSPEGGCSLPCAWHLERLYFVDGLEAGAKKPGDPNNEADSLRGHGDVSLRWQV